MGDCWLGIIKVIVSKSFVFWGVFGSNIDFVEFFLIWGFQHLLFVDSDENII